MSKLTRFLGELFAKFFGYSSALLTKKLAIVALFLTAFYASMTIVYDVLNNYLITLSLDYPIILQAGLMALPSNTDNCIAIVFTTRLTIFIYDTQFRTMQFKLKGI